MQRIGVFVCWCGSNIAATVDVAVSVSLDATGPSADSTGLRKLKSTVALPGVVLPDDAIVNNWPPTPLGARTQRMVEPVTTWL